MTRIKETIGYMLEKKTILCNDAHSGATATSSVAIDNGTCFIDQNQTAATIIYPITGLHTGDRIKRIRIVGAIGAKSGGATTVDADLRLVTGGAGAVTDASCSADITQVDVEADTALDSASASDVDVEVATDYQYYVLVTITTADNAENDVSLTGIEVDVNEDRP